MRLSRLLRINDGSGRRRAREPSHVLKSDSWTLRDRLALVTTEGVCVRKLRMRERERERGQGREEKEKRRGQLPPLTPPLDGRGRVEGGGMKERKRKSRNFPFVSI